jgi:hypothetical protein
LDGLKLAQGHWVVYSVNIGFQILAAKIQTGYDFPPKTQSREKALLKHNNGCIIFIKGHYGIATWNQKLICLSVQNFCYDASNAQRISSVDKNMMNHENNSI